MLVAAVVTFASLLAQAEPAPPEPTSAPPTPAAPAVPIPAPGEPKPPPANTVSVYARFAYRVGDAARRLPPAGGFSIGGSVERRYLRLPPSFELGAAVDFFYDRFAMDVVGQTLDPSGNPTTAPGTRMFTHTSFALLQTAAIALDSIRPFAAIGGGVDIAYFSTPEPALAPGTQTAVMGLVRGVLGLEIPIGLGVAVGVRVDYTHVLNTPSYTPKPSGGVGAGPAISFWGDLFDAGAGVVAHF
jgi:hypothetical protein